MTRWFVVFGLVFACVLAAPPGVESAAAKSKICKATAMDGKQTKWRCNANQKCCNGLLSGQTCIGSSDICL